jgi:hypothetical protein
MLGTEKTFWKVAIKTGGRIVIHPKRVRVIAVPPDLPVDGLNTQALFEQCLGQTFDVIGENDGRLELAVGTAIGVAAHLHSIWIEPDYTDANYTELRLSAKMLNFVIEAIDFRIAAHVRDLANPETSENDAADIGNDKMLLQTAVDYMRGEINHSN